MFHIRENPQVMQEIQQKSHMKIGQSLFHRIQYPDRICQECIHAFVGLRIFHHPEKDFRQEKSQHVLDWIQLKGRSRKSQMHFLDALDIPFVLMLDFQIQHRKRHEQSLRHRRPFPPFARHHI